MPRRKPPSEQGQRVWSRETFWRDAARRTNDPNTAINSLLSDKSSDLGLLRYMLEKIEEDYREQADGLRNALIIMFSCDPCGTHDTAPMSLPMPITKYGPALRTGLQYWDELDHSARHMMIACVGAEDQGDIVVVHAGRAAFRQTLDQVPFLLADRLIHPLFPEQEMWIAEDLAGLVATMLSVSENTINKRLRAALQRETDVPSDAMYEELPSAVFLGAKTPPSRKTEVPALRRLLEEFRTVVGAILEGDEPDVGTMYRLRDDVLKHDVMDTELSNTALNTAFSPASIEELTAREEIRQQKEAKAIEGLAELRTGAGLSQTEDRVLDMLLDGMSLLESARALGSTKTVDQVKKHRSQVATKLRGAAGIEV